MLTERSIELLWVLNRVGYPRRILDVGSADAAYIGVLNELCRTIFLCDTRPIAQAGPHFAHRGPAHKLPNEWGSLFDLITCVSTLDHIGVEAYGNPSADDMLSATVAELHRVMARNGRLLVTVPFGRDHITDHPGGAQRVFGETEFLDLFSDNLWHLQELTTWGIVDGRYTEQRIDDVRNSEYGGWRALACLAAEFIKL